MTKSAQHRKRISLLNPPSERPILRDYYCSTRPKASYLWQPIDLLAMGALLQEHADLQFIDAIAMRSSSEDVMRQINEFRPDAILALVSSLTKREDLHFIGRLSHDDRLIAISGEVALESDFDFVRYPYVDGLLLDFTSKDSANFLLGDNPSGRVRTRSHEPMHPPRNTEFSLDLVPHEAFFSKAYKMPFWKKGFFSLLTSFGCPYSCSFCNSGIDCLGYKLRSIDDIKGELDLLANLGAQRVYLRDMTFGAYKPHAYDVLENLVPYKFDLHAFLHASTIDIDFAKALKSANLTLAQIGVESPLESLRMQMNKHLSDDILFNSFRLLKEAGIATGCHFVVGFPDEPEDIINRCINLCSRLGAAYCSINIYQHRNGIPPLELKDKNRLRSLESKARLAMLKYNSLRWLAHRTGIVR